MLTLDIGRLFCFFSLLVFFFQKLRAVRVVCERSSLCLLAFLDVLVLLSRRAIPAHLTFCKGEQQFLLFLSPSIYYASGPEWCAQSSVSDMVEELSRLHAAPSLDVRIRFLEVRLRMQVFPGVQRVSIITASLLCIVSLLFQLSVNVFCASGGATSPTHSSLLLTAIVATLPTQLTDKQAKRVGLSAM